MGAARANDTASNWSRRMSDPVQFHADRVGADDRSYAMAYLHHFRDQRIQSGHTRTLVGMEDFEVLSGHVLGFRMLTQGLQTTGP